MARSKGMGGGPSMAFEKPRAGAKAILRRLWRYLYHYKWLLAAAVALSLTGNLLALAGPKLSGYAIDAIRPGPGRVDFQHGFPLCKTDACVLFCRSGAELCAGHADGATEPQRCLPHAQGHL